MQYFCVAFVFGVCVFLTLHCFCICRVFGVNVFVLTFCSTFLLYLFWKWHCFWSCSTFPLMEMFWTRLPLLATVVEHGVTMLMMLYRHREHLCRSDPCKYLFLYNYSWRCRQFEIKCSKTIPGIAILIFHTTQCNSASAPVLIWIIWVCTTSGWLWEVLVVHEALTALVFSTFGLQYPQCWAQLDFCY